MKRASRVHKQISQDWTGQGAGATPLPFSHGLTNIVPMPLAGPGVFNRIGSCIGLKRLRVRGAVVPGNNNLAIYQEGYVTGAIYYDRQPNGAIPSIFTSSDPEAGFWPDGSLHYGPGYPENILEADRFVLLWRKVFGTMAVGANGTVLPNTLLYVSDRDKCVVDLDIDLSGLETVLGGGTDGLVNNTRSGQLLWRGECMEDLHGGDTVPTCPWRLNCIVTLDFEDI